MGVSEKSYLGYDIRVPYVWKLPDSFGVLRCFSRLEVDGVGFTFMLTPTTTLKA